MKRSSRRFYVVILVLISIITSIFGVTPASAASSLGLVPLPLPAGWQSGHLYGIWGSGPGDVYAAGYGSMGTTTAPLLYHYNGASWVEMGLTLPTGWNSGYLFGMWGSSAANVYAVGSGYVGNSFLPLLYHFDGISWGAFTLPLPAGWTSGYLYNIWGSSGGDVYAVGYGHNGSVVMPLLYYFDGVNWVESGLAAPDGFTSGNFRGVWGTAPTNVYAIGYGNNNGLTTPLLSRRIAAGWGSAGMALPTNWSSGYLHAIWGSAATDVYTVGYGFNGSQTVPLVYHSNGTSWAESPLSLPTGWQRGYLYGVWGTSATDVYTVGSGYSGDKLIPLLFHNDGTGWVEASPTLPLGWVSGYLSNVWGSSAGDVFAVGAGNNGISDIPLLYHSGQTVQDLVAPGNVTGFAASTTTTSGSITLTWTEPADDAGNNASGPVSAYLIKYSTTPFTSWTQGAGVTLGLPTPGAPGATQSMTVTGLNPDTLYYFAIRAQDDRYNLSPSYATSNATTLDIGAWYISTRGNFLYGVEGDIPIPGDYNGDGRVDVAVYRPSTGTWYITAVGNLIFGNATDIPVPADYNGDGRDDVAVYRPSAGTWYIAGFGNFNYGAPGDIPVPADYNGDGREDVAVYRPSEGTWYIAGFGNFNYGAPGDIPVPADYNGDGHEDIAVFRPSNGTWYISSRGDVIYGTAGDIPVPGDYNGDGRDDIAVFRPSNGTWYIASRGPVIYGTTGDIPVAGDYNGDGWDDIAVFRP